MPALINFLCSCIPLGDLQKKILEQRGIHFDSKVICKGNNYPEYGLISLMGNLLSIVHLDSVSL